MSYSTGHRGNPVRVLACLLAWMILDMATPNPTPGAIVVFKMDNKLDHAEEFSMGEWVTTDTITQSYNLNWFPPISSRMKVGMVFGLTLTDMIASQGVDTKNVAPSVEVSLVNPAWDLKMTWKDAMVITNEFNTPRHDTIDMGADFNLMIDYFPQLKTSYRITSDFQEDNVDTSDRRFESSTAYSFGADLALDGSYRTGDKEDFIAANSDVKSDSWDFNLSYNREPSPGIKVSFANSLKGGEIDTLDHLTRVLVNSTPTRSILNKLRLSWDGYPSLTTSVDVSRTDDKVIGELNDTSIFSFTSDQSILSFGTLKEDIRYSSSKLTSPTAETSEMSLNTSLELTGAPYRYLDYSIKTSMENGDKSNPDPTIAVATTTQTLDISTTFTPSPPLVIDMAYSRSANYTEDVLKATTRTFKLKGDFKGTFLDVPNLTFTPLVSVSRDNDRVAETLNRLNDIKLDLRYVPNLPAPFTLELGPSYSYTETNGTVSAHSLNMVYRMEGKFPLGSATCTFLFNGEFKNDMLNAGMEDTWTLDKEANLEYSQPLTSTIGMRAQYRYKVPSDSSVGIPEHTEAGVTWKYLSMASELLMSRDRTFGGERIETRKYSAKFAMDF